MKIDNVIGDGIGYIELLEWMGGDKQTVDRARKCYQSQERSTPDSDERLLKKLVGSKPLHGTTMRGCVMTFDVLAPLFVVRQWTRGIVGSDYHGGDIWHVGGDSFDIGSSYDEQSFRYTDKIAFYAPPDLEDVQRHMWQAMIDEQVSTYNALRTVGLAKQLARCALGPAVYSQFTWSVNMQVALDFFAKRKPGGGAQDETTKYAVAMMSLIETHVAPKSVQFGREQNGA